uniref:NADH-ubiquinone oxidoreductase chain 6 n=1 Tax=Histeroidea sp. 3 KM-2017 TaxID=2219436 RepID=A0A346RIF1_9COLE|nr:NADH dehydrogenase subunit 6 [Histeroidea sp. 3 KM-2017]
MLLIIMSISLFLIITQHPVSMGMILMMQVVMIALVTSIMINNFWFSYILFLVMIGGMMILFMYMTSVASNEKFKLSYMNMFKMFIICMTIYFLNKFEYLEVFFNLKPLDLSNNQLTKFMNFPGYSITMLMMIYLMLALITVIKMISTNSGPLRQN